MTISEACALVGHSQGLPSDFDGSSAAINNLAADDKLKLTAGVMNYIRNNPEQFTQAQVDVANSDTRRQNNFGTGLVSTAPDLGEFASELGSQAKRVVLDPLANVGNGVSKAVGAIGVLVPVVAVCAFLWLAYTWTKAKAPVAA